MNHQGRKAKTLTPKESQPLWLRFLGAIFVDIRLLTFEPGILTLMPATINPEGRFCLKNITPADARAIIDRYAGICGPTYYVRLRELAVALTDLVDRIGQTEGQLRTTPIDPTHWRDAVDMPWMADRANGRFDVQAEMRAHRDYYAGLRLAIETAASAQQKHKSGTVVPEQIYIDAVKELSDLYETTTGKPVVYPEKRDSYIPPSTAANPHPKETSNQPSTHFIDQCLQAIDPTFDLQKSITTIKRARKWGISPHDGMATGKTYPISDLKRAIQGDD